MKVQTCPVRHGTSIQLF